MSLERTRREHRALAAVLALSLLINLVPVWWGLPSYQGWAFDEIRPSNLEGEAWRPKYPPLHRQVLRLALLPLDALEAAGLAPADDLERYSLAFLIIRLVSVLMATSTVYLIYRCSRLYWGRPASVIAAAIVALMPPFVYYAKTANFEAPYLFWFVLSLFFYLKALGKRRLRDFVWFAVFGALSICTKDQAYGLYLLAPLPLLAALWPERGWRALIDRRIWLSALALAAVVVVVYQLYLGPAELERHVAAATGPRTFSVETPTPTGQFDRLVLAAGQIAFSLSLPFALLAAAGAIAAYRRRPLETLALGAMLLGYYLAFILLLPYQTVRYLLPAALFGGLFAAGAIEAAWRSGRGRPALVLVLGAAFGWALLRAGWVDRSMLLDSRYYVERWLAEADRGAPALGLGRPHMMPRGVPAASPNHLVKEGCVFLNDRAPGHLVINLADLRDEREVGVVRKLSDDAFNYGEALRYRSEVWPAPWGVDRLLSNLDKINPEMVVFERREPLCLDARSLPRALGELQRSDSPELRSRLTEFVLEAGEGVTRIGGDAGALGAGFSYGGWTRGAAPAAVVVTNKRKRPAFLQLRLGCLAPSAALPVTAWIDAGGERRSFTFAKRGRIDARVGRLAPGETRLLLVWSDRSWRAPSGERDLGVSLTEARLKIR